MRRVIVFTAVAVLAWPAAVLADSGTGSIYALPYSTELEGSVQITHECTESPCFWFAEVSAYPAATECPQAFDISHSVWVGESKESPKGSWSSFGHFSFAPEESGNATLCLYVNAGSESDLVGQATRAPEPEVLAPASPPAPSLDAPSSDVPILAGPPAGSRAALYEEGYGHAKPSIIYNGGDPEGRIRHIHWTSWGSAQAVGSGISEYVAPGQIGAEGRPESARVVLFHLGYCRERRAYDAVEWYFPQHGQRFRPHTYIDSCTGQYR
jgi:hypothetical protein